MSTPIVATQHDPTKFINYTGNDPDYYPDAGPTVLPSLHTARVSAHDLDALELAAENNLVITTQSDVKALEISALGIADPSVVDTTVLDTGANALHLRSDGGTEFSAPDIELHGTTTYRSTVDVEDASTPTFHHVATTSRMVLGTGTLDASDEVTSGAFLQTTADSFTLRNDSASISSTAGSVSRIRYAATQAHEFFVGSDADVQEAGSGAIEITADKVIIRKDVDLAGAINSVTSDTTSLQVEDQVIRLAHTDDAATANRDVLLSQGKTGLTIDTVPGTYADDATYMGKFLASDGTKLFVDDAAETIDVEKALMSGAFAKEFAFHLNQGAKTAGGTTETSRLNEPFWQLTGGALHMAHTVPAGNGKAKKFSLGFRITDDGSMEMVRLTNHLTWNATDTTYERDQSMADTAKVLTRYVNAPAPAQLFIS